MGKISLMLLVFVCFFAGCSDPNVTNFGNFGYEDGLRAGHADAKAHGFCDQPFPKERAPGALYNTKEYLAGFESGYFKACAIARKSAPAPKPVSRTSRPLSPRCEAR
jgi:hypothetical protein